MKDKPKATTTSANELRERLWAELKPQSTAEALLIDRLVTIKSQLDQFDRANLRIALPEAYAAAERNLVQIIRQLRLYREAQAGSRDRRGASGTRETQKL